MSGGILYTYGYLGGSLEDLRAYTGAGALVVDTRLSPNSRIPTWRRRALEDALGDRYLWVPELGNRNYRNGGPIEIADLDAGLAILTEPLHRGAVVLLCACSDPRACHRTVVAEAAGREYGFQVRHLEPGEPLEVGD